MNKECTPFVVKIKGVDIGTLVLAFTSQDSLFILMRFLAWSAVHPNTAIIAINSSFFIMIVRLFFLQIKG
mgnify:FL=1